jgi:hypothetical protein
MRTACEAEHSKTNWQFTYLSRTYTVSLISNLFRVYSTTGNMRSDCDVRTSPQLAVYWKRFSLKYVQDGVAQPAFTVKQMVIDPINSLQIKSHNTDVNKHVSAANLMARRRIMLELEQIKTRRQNTRKRQIAILNQIVGVRRFSEMVHHGTHVTDVIFTVKNVKCPNIMVSIKIKFYPYTSLFFVQ